MWSEFVCGSRPSAWPRWRRGLCSVALATALPVLGATFGCTPPVLNLNADSDPAAFPYGKTLDRWSRVGRTISVADLDTPVVVTATLRSRSFQRAFAERYIEAFKISDPAERDKIRERERAIAEGGPSFWVRTTCHSYLWNDLRPQAGKWRVMLIDEAGQPLAPDAIEPISIRDLTQPALLGDPIDPYTKIWAVHFPAQRSDGQPAVPSTAKKIILRAAGPVGQTDLTWLLQ